MANPVVDIHLGKAKKPHRTNIHYQANNAPVVQRIEREPSKLLI